MTQPTWQHDSMITNGLRLHYVTQGEGSLMLMLHGFPEFWYSWKHQIPEFAQDHKVVAVDLRGYNQSDKPTEPEAYRMRELLQDVRGIVLGLGYERCTLVGHDWGGAIAWTFADSYPELVERLIVLNFPHPAKLLAGLKTPQQQLRSWYILFFQLPWLPEFVLQVDNYRLIGEIFKGTASNEIAFPPADLEAYKQAAAQPGALTAMLNYYRANIMQPAWDNRAWRVLDMPILMIWGEADQALGKELTYGTELYASNLTVRYLPEASHWVQQEQPQRVNHYMREFLGAD